MGKAILLKQNSAKIRKKIRDAGISVCICAEFRGSKWLDYHVGLGAQFDVHGLGYGDDEMSGEESIALFLHETKEIVECNDVYEFICEILKNRGYESTKNS